MSILITHIKGLLQVRQNSIALLKGNEMKHLPCIENAFLFIKDGKVEDYGSMTLLQEKNYRADSEICAEGRFVFPSFVDSHTHIVYAGSRESEFVDKIKGLSYEEIARNGGGILNSAKRLQQTQEDELFEAAWGRLQEIIGMGTGAVEIKSGYGLSLHDEIKMLRVIKRLKEHSPICIKSTFLGAHAIPKDIAREEYVKLIVEKMIPQVADEGLAEYCDVFCDKGFFTPEETDQILQQGIKYGLRPKIHANELDFSGGIQVGVKNNALSVDHLEFTGEEEIETLLQSETMPTLLPSTAFFLRLHYPPARKIIDAGLPVALASDYNPGSSPSGNMPFVLSLACVHLRMLPEEAINAATINSAYAMDLSASHGKIQKGLPANIFITQKMPSYSFLPYSFGSNLIDKIILNGKEWK